MGHGLEIGQVLAGKYRIERALGQGGMGLVLLAQHLQLGQRMAIKVMLPSAVATPEAQARFLREARAAAALSNEHIARVFDVDVLPSGAPYMVMEYVDGADLSQVLAQRGPLPWPEAVGYVLQACEGLAEAHARGIVHRDVKPSNLFLARQPDGSFLIKILDFGVAKAPVASGHHLTRVNTLAGSAAPAPLTGTAGALGSPHYMAPEQFESAHSVDARADVWALGVILYQLLTGRRPYEGHTFDEIFVAMVSAPPVPLHALRPDVPPALEHVLQGCLQPGRDRRLPSVGRLAAWLVPLVPSLAPLAQRAARLLGEPHDSVSSPSSSMPPASWPQQASPGGAGPYAPPSWPGATMVPIPSPMPQGSAPAGPRPQGLSPAGMVLGVLAFLFMGSCMFGAQYTKARERYKTLAQAREAEAAGIERRANLPAGNHQHVDAVAIYPAVRALVRGLESDAALVNFECVEVGSDGLVDATGSSPAITYVFQYGVGTKRGLVVATVGQSTITAKRSPAYTGFSLTPAEPSCPMPSVWHAMWPSPTTARLSYGYTALGAAGLWTGHDPKDGERRYVREGACTTRTKLF